MGDLRPKKNLGVLVEAWRDLRAEGLEHRLILAGRDFGEGARLRELAGDEPLELAGFVSDAAVDALLRGAGALAHPGLYEGFGMIAIEAMARGCPAVLADAGALPETAGGAALLFDPHDREGLAAALREVLHDPARRDDLVARGRERAGQRSWAATARATEAVYRELL